MEYNENHFKSVFKTYIVAYLNERRLLKQQIKVLFYSLRDFDNMCFNSNITNPVLTKELVVEWLEKKPNECKNNQSKRASIMRCFGKYMFRNNTQNYVLPKMLYPVKEKYMPHIYTNDEIKRLFNVIDNLNKKTEKDNKPIIMPIIYRILLFTGMRINEALSLMIKDINFKDRIIIIRNAKNNKDRLIPISESLCKKLLNYNLETNILKKQEDYFFRNTFDKKISVDSFYEYFRDYLWQARIPHTGKGPRVHDFRHTFTVNCIHKWLTEDKNVKVLLPYLQTYLGHDTVESTYYYYHMTLGIYPYLEEKISINNNDIVPKIDYNDGAYYE